MKIQRKKSFFTRTRILAFAAVVGIAIIAAAIWWFFMRQPAGSNDESAINSIDYSPPTEEEKQDSAEAKQKAADRSEQQTNPPATTNDMQITISRVNQAENTIELRSIVSGATNGTTCTATFSKDGEKVIKTADIAFQGTLYACNIDVSVTDFSAAGEWDVSVTAAHNNTSSPAAKAKTTITK